MVYCATLLKRCSWGQLGQTNTWVCIRSLLQFLSHSRPSFTLPSCRTNLFIPRVVARLTDYRIAMANIESNHATTESVGSIQESTAASNYNGSNSAVMNRETGHHPDSNPRYSFRRELVAVCVSEDDLCLVTDTDAISVPWRVRWYLLVSFLCLHWNPSCQ